MKPLNHAQQESVITPSTGEEKTDFRLDSKRVALSDKEIDFLESQIPAQAVAATQAAFWNALTRGQSVVYADGNELYEIFPDGSRRFLKSLPPHVSLPADTEFIIK